MPEKSPPLTSGERLTELLARIDRHDGAQATWQRSFGDRVDALEEHDVGRQAADRAAAVRLTEIENDGTSKRLERLEDGLATALGNGLIVSAADLEGRLQAIEELMVPIDEKGLIGMAMRNSDRLTYFDGRIAELAGVALEHTKQLATLEGDVVGETLVDRVQKLEEYNATRLTPMLNARARRVDKHGERLRELEGRFDMLSGAAVATVGRLEELEAHRALYDAADPDLLEPDGDGETLVDDVDDELRILRRANLAASVAAEVAGLDGAHIVSPVLGLLLDLVAHETVGIDELEQYNDAAGCVLSLLTIAEELRDRPQLGTAAVTAAHSLCSTLRDELEGRGALGVDCG